MHFLKLENNVLPYLKCSYVNTTALLKLKDIQYLIFQRLKGFAQIKIVKAIYNEVNHTDKKDKE